MIAWNALNDALEELDAVRAQVREGRALERTSRFYQLLRRSQIAIEQPRLIAAVIELSGGWCVVHWLHDPKSVGLYSSVQSLRHALCDDGKLLLALDDVSERTAAPGSRQAQAQVTYTDIERRILRLLGRGMSNAEIGAELFLADSTIRNRLHRIYTKLGYAQPIGGNPTTARLRVALMARDLDLSEPDATGAAAKTSTSVKKYQEGGPTRADLRTGPNSRLGPNLDVPRSKSGTTPRE